MPVGFVFRCESQEFQGYLFLQFVLGIDGRELSDIWGKITVRVSQKNLQKTASEVMS